MTQYSSSKYIEQQRKEYALYVLSCRSIPHVADGLKHSGRRVLWIGRDGKKRKSATLAGETMCIHPHGDQSLSGAINTLGAHYGNNIPLIKGDGGFGTLLDPTAFAASRYTSATISKFATEVVLRDIEIIPMIENYDGTLYEPVHFLPLIPIVLLNPQSGIAVGFASDILPRSLGDIIHTQIAYLSSKAFKEPKPTFIPINQRATWDDVTQKWQFTGTIEKQSAVNIRITNLPYGLTHEKYVTKLHKWLDESSLDEKIPQIVKVTDGSKDKYDILITFKKGSLSGMTDDDILTHLELTVNLGENLNVIDFDGKRVWQPTYSELIEKFCDWRLIWFKIRYERLAKLLQDDIQRYEDILTAIKKNIGSVARTVESRSELKEFLQELGIVFIDYIADLPVYRFTAEEKEKVEQKLQEAQTTMKRYKVLLKSEDERRKVFIDELKEISSKY